MATRKRKMIRVGVIGLGRGQAYARGAGEVCGMELVALCDHWADKLEKSKDAYPGVTFYTDYDKFLEHDMDAVILANYFHEHAPFAVKALEAGMHVMSETSACSTLAQGVALAEAVEKSGKVYMIAENYCFFNTNQEMRRLYRAGEIGEMRLAECEYMHPDPISARLGRAWGRDHWRNVCPSTYYCTHAIGPILYITETRPTYVNAHSIDYAADETQFNPVRQGDPGFSMLCRMSNGGTTIVNGLALRGHGNWYRIHGSRGLMENLRTLDRGMLRLVHDKFDMRPGDVGETVYRPEFPEHADLAAKAGHGGGDFFTNLMFSQAIQTGKPPVLDVYRALDMTLVGIQGWRSALDKGNAKEIPDFRKKRERDAYRDDTWSPFPDGTGPAEAPPSIVGTRKITARDLAAAKAIWSKQGYRGT
jgi:predicted dehydrogenase